MRRLIVLVGVLGLASCAAQPPPERVWIEPRHAGLFRVNGPTYARRGWPYHRRLWVVKLGQTTRIPAEPETHFGVAFRTHSDPWRPWVRLRERWTTPPITSPDSGKTVTRWSWYRSGNNNVYDDIAEWGMHYSWDTIPGTYTLELLYGDEVIFTQSFEVVAPGSADAGQAAGRPAESSP